MNEILVGVDRSETAKRAAKRAANIAAELDATLVVMSVGRKHLGADGELSKDAAELKRYLESVAAELPHKRITTNIAEGHPADVLCEEAARIGAQMIVVGNHRVQGIASALGSVASDVLRHAPCDVLVVHTND